MLRGPGETSADCNVAGITAGARPGWPAQMLRRPPLPPRPVRGRAVDDTGLPEVGDVFLTDTLIFANGDHATTRPVVVVRAPRSKVDYVTVIQRSTTATTQKGVDHPVDDSLGCDRAGRWVADYQRSARCDQFLGTAEHTGQLDKAYIVPLIEMWEQT